jgi:hypothetical protein
MEIYPIVRELIEERNRVDRTIALLEEIESGSGRSDPQLRRRGRKSMDARARREVSERMKRYWADRRGEHRA